MLAGFIIAAMAVQEAEPRSMSHQAASAFVAAVNCSEERATRASFDRRAIDVIPREAAESCGAEMQKALPLLLNATAVADEKTVREHLGAKMRIAAQGRLIQRLEAGEHPAAGNGTGYHLEEEGGRYISCIRIAVNRRLEGIFLGDGWVSDMRQKLPEARIAALREEGSESCPRSRSSYLSAFDLAMKDPDAGVRKILSSKMSMGAIEDIALKGYLTIWGAP